MFYMYDVEIAQRIKKVYELEVADPSCHKEIEMALNFYHYYVNPKNYQMPFEENYNRLYSYFEQEIEKGALNTLDRKKLVAILSLKVIKELFDVEYFEKRLKYHKNDFDKECLLEYISQLDVSKLKEFLPVAIGSGYVLTNDKEIETVWEKLNEECLKKDSSAHVITNIYDKYGYFNREIPMYFFDYLDKETIIDVFCRSICDENKYRAANLARIMLYEGLEEVKCTISCWQCDC